MRNAFLKDTFREIKKTFSRFIAIIAIIALGTAFFVGIKTTSPDMKLTADKYYKDQQFMDFKLASTVGFNAADLVAIKEVAGTKGIMPMYSLDVTASIGNNQKILRINSLPDDLSSDNNDFINCPQIVSGRLPEKSGECAIEKSAWTGTTYEIGDLIKINSGDKSILADKISQSEYTVVGIVNSPYYISRDRGTTTIGNGQVSAFMLVPGSDFKVDYYSSIFITAAIDNNIEAYSTRYDDAIALLKSELETFATKRADIRFQTIKTDAQKTLDENKQEYDKSVKDANLKLANALKKIRAGQKQITDGKVQLDAAKLQSEKTFADAQKQIDQGKVQLAGATMMPGYQSMIDSLNVQQQKLDAGKLDAQKQFDIKEAELKKAQADLNRAKIDYEDGKAKASLEFADALKKLDDAQAKIDSIPAVNWYVLGRDTNVGYVDYRNAADRTAALATVFPLIFILVSILICFTSMGRMVEEQRMYMGTTKALGYRRKTIIFKFLIYALMASIIGSGIGLAIGFTMFPGVIINAYSVLYALPKTIMIFDIPFAALAFGVSLAVTCVSSLIVSIGELNSNAASLMRPRTPKAGKPIILEKVKFIWSRLKFTQKVTARNILRYKSRFFMTVIGVAGCTALLLVGFGLGDAVKTIGDKQYGELMKYQVSINLKDNISAENRDALFISIKQKESFQSQNQMHINKIDIGYSDKALTCNLVVPENSSTISQYIILRDRTTASELQMQDDSVIITEKLAKLLGANIGDTIYIKNGDYEKLNITISGICENYMYHFIYMSPALYQNLYKEAPTFNQIFVNLKDKQPSAQQTFSESIVALEGVSSATLMSDNTSKFNETIMTVYNIVLVLIFSAGLLSFVVLYTLTNINISERMREIATIKVLGFYDREVSGYVFRENIILTIIGMLVGLVLGNFLSGYVVATAEIDIIMFGRQIYPISFVYAAILTLFFASLVTIVMLRKLKKINMVEALKTNE